MSHPLERFRDEFPILGRKTYLASHSLGAVPRGTADALAEYHRQWATLGIEAWDGPWWQAVVDFGTDVEAILGAEAGTVAPMPNATRAMAAVASCLDLSGPRNKVILTDLEFTTFYPFWRRQEALGAKVVLVPSPDGVQVPHDQIAAAIDRRTALVATCHAYFRSGALQDITAVAKAAHDHGAYCLIDGYQLAGARPIDVRSSGVDFYVGGSHKWLLGGAGAGYLYVRKDRHEALEPRLTGWFGLEEPFAYTRDLGAGRLHPGVLRFLDGTPNVPGLYAAREGIRLIRKAGLENIRDVSRLLTERILNGAEALGATVRSPRSFDRRNGMVCLDFPGAKEATDALVKQGIIVDWRPDCGMRVSPHFYNNTGDVDRFLEALGRLVRKAGVPRAA